MNALARAVHDLMIGEEVAGLHDLSPLEREALADLQSVLRRPPQHLAALLAQAEPPIPWGLRPHRPGTGFDPDLGFQCGSLEI